MPRKLKIAAIQMDSTPAPVPERLNRTAELVAQATDAGAQLVVLPELFNTGYEFHERNYARAETIDGQTARWMKAQATQHHIHLTGTLLLLDEQDIYNTALLVAPDGRTWRYDKMHPWGWERAYFRPGRQTTVADTDLGKLGMMICADMLYADVWAQYAGKVQVMILMNCPGDTENADLIFPDGFRIKYPELFETASNAEGNASTDDTESFWAQFVWIDVPAVGAGGTGSLRTKLPGLEDSLLKSKLADRVHQSSEVWLETGFAMATFIGHPADQVPAVGSTRGDGVVLAEIELPDIPPQPQYPQPKIHPVQDPFFEDMILLYRQGVRRQWGDHMAPE